MFQTELSWIQTPELRRFAEQAVERLPDYFFHVAASSTGKYHPSYALGDGGLVRHTKAALQIAHDLSELEQYQLQFPRSTIDCILIAIMFHDGWKHGDTEVAGKYTVFDHPLVAAGKLKSFEDLLSDVSDAYVEVITSAVASHMGQWTADRSKKDILPKPITDVQKFVHLCDYLASRKYLVFEFGDSYYNSKNFEISVTREDKDKLISLCKEKIAAGVDRDKLYDIIQQNNDGKKNPNTITDPAIYQKVFEEIQMTEA